MYEQLEKMSLQEIVRYAIASEDAAGNYYRSLVKFLKPNELISHKFEFLAMEEDIHRKVLVQLYEQMFGAQKYQGVFGVKGYVFPKGLPPLEGAIKVKTVENLLEALDIAMLSEDRAHNIYKFLSKKDKEHRALFERLAMLEQGHYNILKAEKMLCEGVLMEDPSLKEKEIPHFANYYGKMTL
jgi:rubrerythrin